MVIALVGLIFILLLVFVLIIRGQSKKYAKKTDSGEPAPSPAGWAGLPRGCLPFSRGGGGWGGVSLSPGSAQASYTISTSNSGFSSNKRNQATQPGGEKGGGETTQSEGTE